MAHNQQLTKLVDKSHKAYARWKKQMQVEGHTKREELSAEDANPSKMSALCRLLWSEYENCVDEINDEIANPSQPSLGVDEGEVPPTSKGKKKAALALAE